MCLSEVALVPCAFSRGVWNLGLDVWVLWVIQNNYNTKEKKLSIITKFKSLLDHWMNVRWYRHCSLLYFLILVLDFYFSHHVRLGSIWYQKNFNWFLHFLYRLQLLLLIFVYLFFLVQFSSPLSWKINNIILSSLFTLIILALFLSHTYWLKMIIYHNVVRWLSLLVRRTRLTLLISWLCNLLMRTLNMWFCLGMAVFLLFGC